ncbi:TetR/AcrR family transcriptional regulator [Nocardioides sp. Bht2]|uniref:TetR/AcrR family transcriptional regulator n=1 Tax=Nocardioides sp. Bht2 TaxID=3392297 RepID=UPI0039B675D1
MTWQPTPSPRILVAAGRLFSEFGVAATTVRQIADEAQMSLGGLYHHFSSKEAIASELVLRFLMDLESAYIQLSKSQAPVRARTSELVRVSLQVSAAHPWATETYLREFQNLDLLPDVDRIRTAVLHNEAFWHGLAAAGIESGEFRTDLDVHEFTRALSETVWLTVKLYRPVLAEQYPQLADEVVKILLDGYRTDPARVASAEGVQGG